MPGSQVLLQGEEGQAISMLEVSLPDAFDQQQERSRRQNKAHENGEDQDIHWSLLPEERHAVTLTTAIELSGMSTAATTGVTIPR